MSNEEWTTHTALHLKDADVEIKGFDSKGERIRITGKVNNTYVDVTAKNEQAGQYGFSPAQSYALRLSPNPDANGSLLTVYTKEKQYVDRTARITATDRTAAAIEKARVAVGAPTKAQFRMGDMMRMDGELRIEPVGVPNPITVEFYWNEEVYL